MAQIIDGKKIAARMRSEVAEGIFSLRKNFGITPGLAAILVGDDPASDLYVSRKRQACAQVGIYSEEHRLPAQTKQGDLLALIEKLGASEKIHGILIQLPLPPAIDEAAVLRAVSPLKDVDGFHPENMGMLMEGSPRFISCTPYAVAEIVDSLGIGIAGKNAVIVGASNIVGKPLAALLLGRGATVTVCHLHTKDLASFTKRAELLVVAIGCAGFIKGEMIKDGAVVIDVGINRDEKGAVTGDVDFASARAKCSYITPVPGGVGPVTITMLLRNTLEAAKFFARGCK